MHKIESKLLQTCVRTINDTTELCALNGDRCKEHLATVLNQKICKRIQRIHRQGLRSNALKSIGTAQNQILKDYKASKTSARRVATQSYITTLAVHRITLKLMLHWNLYHIDWWFPNLPSTPSHRGPGIPIDQ